MSGESNAPLPRIYRRRDVEAVTGLKRSSIYERVTAGSFPKPIKLGARSVGWLASDVHAWVEARVAESRGQVQQ